MSPLDVKQFFWLFKPRQYSVGNEKISIVTQPETDLWQRTYYGFRNDNAPMLLTKTSEKFFSFTVKTSFAGSARFDQCGVVIYQNSDNWFKASVEAENDACQRLGSVVTNRGFSDWASTDIAAAVRHMHYRLSRRESDFCIEHSLDGTDFKQMRIFHLFAGGGEIQFGLYACSPSPDASFHAEFTRFSLTPCLWKAHE